MFVALINFIFKITGILTVTFLVLSTIVFVYIKFIYEPIKSVCKSNARLDNKIVLITGGNNGIGLETARDLASRGARVIIASRDTTKSINAVSDIIKTTGNEKVEYKYLNLASFKSIRKFAEDFNNSYDCLDILINNAGCEGLKHKITEDGIEIVMQINYLGPFMLTNLLLEKIEKSVAGRIIIVTSYVHRFGRISPEKLNGISERTDLMKYCNSKLCNVMWMKALAKRLPSNVTVNSLHPGLVRTDLFRRVIPFIRHWLMLLLNILDFKTPKEGAQTSIYLAVAEEVSNVSGKYFIECSEAKYATIVDNDEAVEKIWRQSVKLTSSL